MYIFIAIWRITLRVTDVLPARIRACAASNLRTIGSMVRDQGWQNVGEGGVGMAKP